MTNTASYEPSSFGSSTSHGQGDNKEKALEKKCSLGRVFGAALLIAGTSIGAGMLGLPVKTAAAGMYPTTITYLLVWLIMLSTALMTLEVSFYFKGNTNMISMASETIGPWAGNVMKLVYLLFFYSVMASYTTQGVSLTSLAIDSAGTSSMFSKMFSMLCFVTPFALVVFMGAYWVDQINRGFIFGLVLCFGMLVFTVLKSETQTQMGGGSFSAVIPALTLIVTSLGFHGIIPSLKEYLHNDAKKIRASILIGSFIPVGVYILWQYVILSHVPVWGSNGLVALADAAGNPGEKLIAAVSSKSGYASIIVVIFSLCAIFSSYVGVALGITDFLFDGLKSVKKIAKNKPLIVAMTFIPPVVFAIFYPDGFMTALSYAGIFASILLVIFPALMLFFGRSKFSNNEYKLNWGKPLALFATAFGTVIILMELAEKL